MASDAKMTSLSENVIQQISELFPIKSGKRSLVLKGRPWVEDSLDPNDIHSQLEAKLNDQTWGVPVKANFEIIDHQTGKPISKPSTVTLLKLPKLTNRHSFIVDGGEYQVDHLLKLKSGIYTKVQDNGDLTSSFMLRQGGHKNFDLYLDRKHSHIKFIKRGGGAKIPVYPLMKVMGVSDDDMIAKWGKAVFEANKIATPEAEHRVLRTFWDKTGGDPAVETPTLEQMKQHVFTYFDDTKLLPETTKATVGAPFTKVTGQALLLGAGKLLQLERKEVDPDDSNSLVFKEVAHVEDFIPEKLRKVRRKIEHKIRTGLTHKNTVSEVLTGGEIFRRPVTDFFTTGGNVSERGEQTNPVQMLSGSDKTTIVAKDYGGISDAEKLRDAMRSVNPSHFGFLDPMHTPESSRTGVTLHLGTGVKKNGPDLEAPAWDPKTGKMRQISVPEFHGSTVVLADQVKWIDGKPHPIAKEVKAKLPGGSIGKVPFKNADLVMRSAKAMFSYTSNLIPFLQNDQGNRASMADKQIEQAISLKHREVPHVQSLVDESVPSYTFERHIGSKFAAHSAPAAGKVVSVTPDEIHVQEGKTLHKIPLYNNFPLNDPTTMFHSHPRVKVGDEVRKGQVLADTNFTKNGTLALGTNLRIGYIPYKGYNFEDGIVISREAADKLTSEHLYKQHLEIDPTIDKVGKNTWFAHQSRTATSMTKDQLDALDKDGVIREGVVVRPGQVLAAALGPNTVKSQDMIRKYGNKAVSLWRDKSLTWDSDYVGVVTKVVKAPSGKSVKVFVKTEEPAEIGDKLSGRHGNKGIITKILPKDDMPFTLDPKTGERQHLEVLLNPSGIPTRINVGQVLETAAAKIAEKTGKPYIVNNFAGAGHNYLSQVQADLKKHGLTDEELVYDPKDIRKPLGSVLVGPQHILKLKHQVEKKLVVRGGDSDLDNVPYAYDVDMQPVRGGPHGGQGFGALETYALLGHDARHNLREMATYKSDMQGPDFWRMISEGHEPPPPKIPFSYQKFEALLKGMGVDVQKHGTSMRMTPMTDREILKAADGGRNEITRPLLILSKTMRPEKGGLFDPIATGGLGGTKWSFIRLSEPLPNPIFVGDLQNKGPVPSLLSLKHGNITVGDIDSIIEGKRSLDGAKGGHAISDALKKIDVDEEIKKIREELPKRSLSKRDHLNRTLKYLLALKEAKLKPHEAYMMKVVPVIPPVFRPLTTTASGDIAKSSLNDIYKSVTALSQNLAQSDPNKVGYNIGARTRAELWNNLKALQAVGKYTPIYDKDDRSQRPLKGLMDIIGSGEGEQPKESYFQEHLVKRKQDLSIRSTIVPEPSLHIDEVGLPAHAAMELYKPFVVAHMHTKWQYKPHEALEEMQKHTDTAKRALAEVMQDRPLLLKRDPALHKFNVMAFRPKVVEGKAIKIHPLVTGGYNADFDGDTMAGTVPVSAEAVAEAKKMFPSKNLFSPTTYGPMHVPNQEFLLGLNLATKWGKPVDKSFHDYDALKKAYEDHHIGLTDVVHLGGKPTTVGRAMIAKGLPETFEHLHSLLNDPMYVIDKKRMNSLVGTISKNHPEKFNAVVNHLKDLGTDWSYKEGFSLGLKDFHPIQQRDAILQAAQHRVDQINKSKLPASEANQKIISVWEEATDHLKDAAKKEHAKNQNRLGTMVYSGARGKTEQYQQMVAAPMLVRDATNAIVPHPITSSYGEGLDLGDYWLAQHGARKGTLNRASGTREPGALTKDVINSTISTLITSPDCKTTHGISMSLDPKDPRHEDIYGRFLAKDHGPFKAGELVDPQLVTQLRASLGKNATVQVRSPLRCQHGSGICAKCFGLNENGKLHPEGTNIGILAGQALGEPATQLAMDAFHTGGVEGGKGGSSVSRIERLKQLLKMPKTLRGSAALAKTTGQITAIKPNPGMGGHVVTINGIEHKVPAKELNPTLKIGAQISRGDSLSVESAPVHPKELLHITKDMHKVQHYLVDELYNKLYKDEGVRPRNIELVVRSLTNFTRIKEPGSSHWEVGDKVPHSEVEEYNRGIKGMKHEKPVVHEPVLEGSGQIPRLTENWMARLNYQRLGETVQRAAGSGWNSDVHGTHPIPGIARGSEFGKPPAGKPKYVY